MSFPISAGLLDAMVLSVVDRGDTYGYEITQFIRGAVDVSESTLYPVLRRLQKGDLLETYEGESALTQYRSDWYEHKAKIDSILLNEVEKK